MLDTFLGAPTADNWRTYSPVLRAKASEWQALKRLTPGVRRRIAPILEFIPDWKKPGADTSGRKRRAPQTPAAHITRMLESSVAATPAGTRSFIYFGLAHPSAIWSGIDLWGRYAADVPASARVVPLADLSSLASASSLANAAQARGELGLRLGADDIGLPVSSHIGAALRLTGLGPGAVHIVVDLKDAPAARSHGQIRTALRNADEFASVVVLAGVFPTDLTQYQPGVTSEPRTEWITWWRDHVATPTDERMLAFGDYSTQCARYQPSPEVPADPQLRPAATPPAPVELRPQAAANQYHMKRMGNAETRRQILARSSRSSPAVRLPQSRRPRAQQPLTHPPPPTYPPSLTPLPRTDRRA